MPDMTAWKAVDRPTWTPVSSTEIDVCNGEPIPGPSDQISRKMPIHGKAKGDPFRVAPCLVGATWAPCPHLPRLPITGQLPAGSPPPEQPDRGAPNGLKRPGLTELRLLRGLSSASNQHSLPRSLHRQRLPSRLRRSRSPDPCSEQPGRLYLCMSGCRPSLPGS
jgi:hypothetical protein